LVEGVHLDPAANEIGNDSRLKALTLGFSRRACGGRTT